MTCTNHPAVKATHTADMPSAVKQPDGRYSELVPLCDACAVRIAAIGGFPVNVLA